jgi:hypothetical protein
MAEGSRVGEVKLTRAADDRVDAALVWVQPGQVATLAERSRVAGALAIDIEDLDHLRSSGPFLAPVSDKDGLAVQSPPSIAALFALAAAAGIAGIGLAVAGAFLALFLPPLAVGAFALGLVAGVGAVLTAWRAGSAWSKRASASRRWAELRERARIRRRHPTLGPARAALDQARRRLAAADAAHPVEHDLAAALMEVERALSHLETVPPEIAKVEAKSLLEATLEVGALAGPAADGPSSSAAERLRTSVHHARAAMREHS